MPEPEPTLSSPARVRRPNLVTVVLPVRNGADEIGRQLGALAAQTYDGDWEVVVADNGSSDGTDAVVRTWADRLPNLRVIDASARAGVGAARNAGTRAAKGDAVLYCDADDQSSPEWVGCMVAALAEHPIVGGPCSLEDADGTRSPSTTKLNHTFGGVPFPVGANFGVRVDVFDEVGGFDEDHPDAKAEDAEFCLRAWERGHEAAFAPGALMVKSRRSDVRSIYRQWRGYGVGAMFNICRFRDRGIAGWVVRHEVRAFGWLIVHLVDITTVEGRQRWVRWIGGHIGWVEGYVRFRRLPVAPRPPGARPFIQERVSSGR